MANLQSQIETTIGIRVAVADFWMNHTNHHARKRASNQISAIAMANAQYDLRTRPRALLFGAVDGIISCHAKS